MDLQGCLPKNHLHTRHLCYNLRKVYIIVKLIKFRIRSAHKPSNTKLTVFAQKSEIPNFLLARTTKLSAQCQSVGDRLQRCVTLF